MNARATPLSVHEELLTVQEVAAEYRVHEETVRRWVRSGVIKGVLVGGFRVKIRRSEVAKQMFPTAMSYVTDPEVPPAPVDPQPEEEAHDHSIDSTPSPESPVPDNLPSGSPPASDPLPVRDDPPASTGPRGRRKNRW